MKWRMMKASASTRMPSQIALPEGHSKLHKSIGTWLKVDSLDKCIKSLQTSVASDRLQKGLAISACQGLWAATAVAVLHLTVSPLLPTMICCPVQKVLACAPKLLLPIVPGHPSRRQCTGHDLHIDCSSVRFVYALPCFCFLLAAPGAALYSRPFKQPTLAYALS